MKKFAVVRRNGLGDLLCAFPLVLFLREQYPDAWITLFVDKSNAPLLAYLPKVASEVVVFPSGHKYWQVLKTAWAYRRRRFDVAMTAKTSPMKLMNLFLYVLGAKERIAPVDHRWHRSLINRPIPYDPSVAVRRHQALKGVQMWVPQMEQLPEKYFPRLSVGTPLLTQLPGPVLLLSASNNRKTSRFCPKRTVALLNRLFASAFFSVLIIGMKGDEEHAEALAEGLSPTHSTRFPEDFDVCMRLLAGCDVLFVGDGGVAHLGAALGKHEVVLYGKTLPAEWAPLNPKATVLFHPEDVKGICDEAIYEALSEKLNQF